MDRKGTLGRRKFLAAGEASMVTLSAPQAVKGELLTVLVSRYPNAGTYGYTSNVDG